MNDLIMRLLGIVATVISPELRNVLTAYVKQLDEQAKKTANPWDDIFVDVLKHILNMK